MHIESIVSICLEAIEQGASIETCLARYPANAEELAPLLHLATSLQKQSRPRMSPQAFLAGRQTVAARAAQQNPSFDSARAAGTQDGVQYTGSLNQHVLGNGTGNGDGTYNANNRFGHRRSIAHGSSARRALTGRSHLFSTSRTSGTRDDGQIPVPHIPGRQIGHRPRYDRASAATPPRQNRRWYHILTAVAALFILISVATILQQATVSVPGMPLYGIKTLGQQAQGLLMQAAGEGALWHAHQTLTRIDELGQHTLPASVPAQILAGQIENHIQQALTAAAYLSVDDQRTFFTTWLDDLARALTDLVSRHNLNPAALDMLEQTIDRVAMVADSLQAIDVAPSDFLPHDLLPSDALPSDALPSDGNPSELNPTVIKATTVETLLSPDLATPLSTIISIPVSTSIATESPVTIIGIDGTAIDAQADPEVDPLTPQELERTVNVAAQDTAIVPASAPISAPNTAQGITRGIAEETKLPSPTRVLRATLRPTNRPTTLRIPVTSTPVPTLVPTNTLMPVITLVMPLQSNRDERSDQPSNESPFENEARDQAENQAEGEVENNVENNVVEPSDNVEPAKPETGREETSWEETSGGSGDSRDDEGLEETSTTKSSETSGSLVEITPVDSTPIDPMTVDSMMVEADKLIPTHTPRPDQVTPEDAGDTLIPSPQLTPLPVLQPSLEPDDTATTLPGTAIPTRPDGTIDDAVIDETVNPAATETVSVGEMPIFPGSTPTWTPVSARRTVDAEAETQAASTPIIVEPIEIDPIVTDEAVPVDIRATRSIGSGPDITDATQEVDEISPATATSQPTLQPTSQSTIDVEPTRPTEPHSTTVPHSTATPRPTAISRATATADRDHEPTETEISAHPTQTWQPRHTDTPVAPTTEPKPLN